MCRRVLIVGTVPYNTKSTSRAFDAYFHCWKKENLVQIFSNTKKPCKGHCGELFQITDYQILKKRLGHRGNVGTLYRYEELEDSWTDNDLEVLDSKAVKAYRIGQKHTAWTHLLRGLLWHGRIWHSDKLDAWMDRFGPEAIFLAFSDDYFINWIALYAAKRYNIPIISCIGDDYYFNKHFSINPFYQIYKESYKALIRKVLSWQGSAIYISDKIRDKYNSEFLLNGETVYLTSTVRRKPFSPVNTRTPLVTYFGNIRMGRNHSLNAIGTVLGQINPNYKLEVYSNEDTPSYYKELEKNTCIVYRGSIPYEDVQKKVMASDITVIAEGFAPSEVELSRYSLSTKAADALASGAAILVYGSSECGIVEYMQSTHAAMVCTDRSQLEAAIRTLLTDIKFQRTCYEQAVVITQRHHDIAISTHTFQSVLEGAIKDYGKE